VGAVTGFATTYVFELMQGTHSADAITKAVDGAIGGAIAGVGIDIGLALAASGGWALVAGAGIAYALGGLGNLYAATATSSHPLSLVESLATIHVGGTYNLISFGLGLGYVAPTIMSVSNLALMDFTENLFTGALVTAITGITTMIFLPSSSLETKVSTHTSEPSIPKTPDGMIIVPTNSYGLRIPIFYF